MRTWRIYKWDPTTDKRPIYQGEVLGRTARDALEWAYKQTNNQFNEHLYVIPLAQP